MGEALLHITSCLFPIVIFRDREIIGLECPQKLSPNELLTIPLFLRFDNVNVSIWYNHANQPIEEKCKSIENQLLPLKLALCDSNVVQFTATISGRDHCYFSDHSMLLDFIRNRFLPICNSSRRYEFQIWFRSEPNSGTNVITSILEMDEIKHCSNVQIGIIDGEQKQLPIDEISNWLERSADVAKNSLQSQRERFLEIYYHYYTPFIQNGREMLEHLAKVYFKTFVLGFFCNFNEFLNNEFCV